MNFKEMAITQIRGMWSYLTIAWAVPYVKCGLKCFRFLSNIKIEKIENFDFLKNLQKNVK